MAHQVVWLQAALDDLEEVAESLAADSPTYACAVVQRIFAVSRDLVNFPFIGARVREWDDEAIRQRLIHSYRLIYQVQSDMVVILAVVHGARLLPDSVRHRT
jgi:toxin ParE1/3/4